MKPVWLLGGAVLLAAGLACGDAHLPEEAARGAATAAAGSASRAAQPGSGSGSAGWAGRKPRREGSALGVLAPRELLFALQEDLHTLSVLALPLDAAAPLQTLQLPGPPAQLVVLRERVLVTVREPGLLLEFHLDAAGTLQESRRLELPVDAWGLAVDEDAKRAVVSSPFSNRLSGVDLQTFGVLWSVAVDREPRAVLIPPGSSRALVTHLTSADLTEVSNLGGAPIVKKLSFPAAPLRTGPQAKPSILREVEQAATLGYSMALSADGKRLFAPRQALGATGSLTWNGHATVDILLVGSNSPLAKTSGLDEVMWTGDFPRVFQENSGIFMLHDPWITGPGPKQRSAPFLVARDVIYRESTQTLLIADEGGDTLVELDALSLDPSTGSIRGYGLAPPGAASQTECGAPSAVALSNDEGTAYVLCRSTQRVVAVSLAGDSGVLSLPPTPVATVSVGKEPLSDKAARGRRLFFNASDSILSGGASCSSCHPEGRDDGHVWHEDHFKQGDSPEQPWRLHAFEIHRTPEQGLGRARQTPMLAGRVDELGPYGWKGENPTLRHRVVSGFGLHRWFGGNWSDEAAGRLERAEALMAFLRDGLRPLPPLGRELTAQELRGKSIFESSQAACATCHDPRRGYTNRAVAELPPLPVDQTRFDAEREDQPGFKTPSLFGLRNSAPYYHDGSAATLALLVDQNGSRMGHSDHLNAAQRADLVAFLETL